MKKQIIAAIVCATVIMGGCSTNKQEPVPETTTVVETSTATEETTTAVEETTIVAEEETDGTQEVAELVQPTLSEVVKRVVEESIAAAGETVSQVSQNAEDVPLPESERTFTVYGKSFVLGSMSPEEFYELFPRTAENSNKVLLFSKDDNDGWGPYNTAYIEGVGYSVLNGVDIGAIDSNRNRYDEATDIYMDWNGHCIGDVLTDSQVQEEGFEFIGKSADDAMWKRMINDDVSEVIYLLDGVIMVDELSYEGPVTTAQ